MRVCIHGKGDAGVAQPFRDHFDIDASPDHEGSIGMPEIMKTEMGQSRFPQHPGKGVGYRARVKRPAIRAVSTTLARLGIPSSQTAARES